MSIDSDNKNAAPGGGRRNSDIHIIISFVSLAAFLALLYLVIMHKTAAFDDAVRFFFYDMRSDGLTIFAEFITFLGSVKWIIALCIILLLIKPLRISFDVPVSAGALSVTIINKIIKILVQRERPDLIFRLVDESGFSFASGHSVTSMVVYGLLIYLVRRNVRNRTTADILTVILAIPLTGIGLSRIYLGVHYPTDVLAGWCLGLTAVMLIIEITESIRQRRNLPENLPQNKFNHKK